MKYTIFSLILFLLINTIGFSQTTISGKLVNRIGNNPVEFANIWLVGENIGATSDPAGVFKLEIDSIKTNNVIKISAIGFYDTSFIATTLINNKSLIKLKEKKYTLSEVIVKPGHKTKKYILNTIKRKDFNLRIASNNQPRMIAAYFPYSDNKENSMLKEIIIYTFKNEQDYLCNIRLHKSENMIPGAELINRNITFDLKKGERNIHVDLAPYKLEFPEEGIFVCFEWLIIEQNKYKLEYTNPENNRKQVQYIYGPNLAGTIEEKSNYMMYSDGTWKKAEPLTGDNWGKDKQGKYCNPAISLVILK